MNAARPRLTISGCSHHRSVRSVRAGMSARLGEKTPVAGRFTAGALIKGDPLHVGSSEDTQITPARGVWVPISRWADRDREPRWGSEPGAADPLVVDVAPELVVVLGVGDDHLLFRRRRVGAAARVERVGVGIE